MNRLAGIIIAVIGLIIAVLSILKVSPPLTSTGVFLLILGGLMIGLSFVPMPDPEDVPLMSTPSTLANIAFSPSEVFRNLRRHPRWLVALILTSVISTVYVTAFLYRLTPDRVANYAIDKTLEMPMLNEEARKQIEAGRADALEQNKNPILRTGQAINSFAFTVFWTAFLALVFFLFTMAMGGQINYWQAFSLIAYASLPVAVLRYGLSLIILFIKDPTDIHPLLGQASLIQDNLNFLTASAEHPVIYVILSGISLLWLYWVILTYIGLKNAGERVTSSIAMTASVTIWILSIALSAVVAMLFPTFFS